MWQPVAQWRPRRYQDLERSVFWLAAAHGLRDEAAKLLRLPRVGLHLWLGKIALNIDLDGLQTFCHVGRHRLNFLDLSYECPELIAIICSLQIQNLAETRGSG